MRYFLCTVFSTALCKMVLGQTACDSLQVLSIGYSPFTDSLIVVQVENENQNEIFDYPGFVLLNPDGDTVAVETVNYFGIAQTSTHLLTVRPAVHDPLEDFMGELRLYSGFYEELECIWSLDRSLCLETACDSAIIGFQNWGGALVLGSFAWSVLDSTGAVLGSGVLEMTEEQQYWFHGMCLEPGQYAYTLYALGEPTGGGPYMTVTTATAQWEPGLAMPFDWFSGNVLDIPFYLHCVNEGSAMGITDADPAQLSITDDSGNLVLHATSPIRQVQVWTIDGRLVQEAFPDRDAVTLHRPSAAGVLLIRALTDDGVVVRKVW